MTGTDVIDLGIGQPEDAILPREMLKSAAMIALSDADNNSCLQYGPEEGAESLREALSDFLTRHYGVPVAADELLVTNGASHGLDLMLARFTSPGDTVCVEAPTYFLGLDVLRDRKVRLVPVPVEADGIDTDALDRLLKHDTPAFVYTIPAFQNPTGVTMSPSRRERLAELAGRYDCLIVADEVYQLVAEASRVPAPMRAFERERVVSLGSFSKILGPGVRLGWIECSPQYLRALRKDGVLRSGGGASPMTGAIVEAAIRSGLQDQFLTQVRAVYDKRRQHAISVLSRTLPEEIKVTYPAGGYYIWLELPAWLDTRDLRLQAVTAGVSFRPGIAFSVDGAFANCMRLCFVYHGEERLTVAMERLAKVLASRAACRQ